MEHDESKQQPDGDSTSTVQPAYTMEQLQAPASLLPGVLNRFGLGDVRFSEQTSSDVLLAALSDASWTVRVAALRALAQRDVHAFLPPLLMAASDENAFVRAAALQPLGTIADPAALAALLQALQDPQWNVRLMAARSLGRYGTDVPLDVLVDVLDDEHELVREAAKLALKQVNQQPSRSEAAMAAVVDDDDQQHQDILPIQDMQDELAHTDMNQSRDKKTIYERYPLPLKESKNMSDNDDFQNQLPEQDNFNSDNSQPTLISNVRRPVGRRRLKPWNLIAAAAAILFVLFNGVIWFALSSQQAASHYTVGKRNVLSVTPATRVPATPLPAHTPTAAATPTPTASPAVTPAPIASPTPSPAVSPTPVPSPQPTATPQPHVYVPATTSCNASPQSGNPGSTAIVTPTPTQGTTPPVGTILVTYSGHS
ncbi:MAG TPA: HEAT repeat domain-containing protein, partial [Ktedonobacteraceae bacterium]|nr:HEAT repeat domain-containing protein [Ktedonobacteraceae bacterium]